MLKVSAGIIDDGYPVMDEKRIPSERINQLIQNEDWGFEESLRELNIKLNAASLLWKRKIHFEGFNHPETYMNVGQFDFDFLIYDWEYKPFCEPHEILLEILQRTQSKIFIFSGFDKVDRIPEILDEARFKPFLENDRYQILSKSDEENVLAITNAIVGKFKEGESFNWNEVDIIIKPSKYIIDSDEFWMLRVLLGSENILTFLREEDTNVIDENSIQRLFERSEYKFYIDRKKSILSASNNELIVSKLGELIELPIAEAVEIFGIEKLEEAREKGFTIIK